MEELAKVAEGESNLIQLISEMGGAVESTERQTDHESVCWVPQPLLDSNNMQAILARKHPDTHEVAPLYKKDAETGCWSFA